MPFKIIRNDITASFNKESSFYGNLTYIGYFSVTPQKRFQVDYGKSPLLTAFSVIEQFRPEPITELFPLSPICSVNQKTYQPLLLINHHDYVDHR